MYTLKLQFLDPDGKVECELCVPVPPTAVIRGLAGLETVAQFLDGMAPEPGE